MSFAAKTSNNLFWAFIDAFGVKAVSLGILVLLTRVLDPEDFGLMSIIQIVVVIGSSILDGGLGSSLIKDTHADNRDFSSVFFFSLFIGCIVYILIYLASPFLARLFEQPVVEPMLRVYAVVFIINPFYATHHNVMMKRMNFKGLAWSNIPGMVSGGILSIWMAYYGYGVWSIVALYVSADLIRVLFTWFISSWRPTFILSFKRLKSHINFGSKLMFASIIDAASEETYTFFIAQNFAVRTLGFYSRAKSYSFLPAVLSSTIISRATFPALSQLDKSKARVSEHFKSISSISFFLITPLLITLVAIASPLFELVFTSKWLPAVPYFRIISFASILLPLHMMNKNVFKVFGHSMLFLKLTILKQLLTLAAIIIGVNSSIYGMIWGMVSVSYITLFINSYYSSCFISYSMKERIEDTLPVFLVSCLSAYLGFFVSTKAIEWLSLTGQISVTTFVSLSCYVLIIRLVKPETYALVSDLVKKYYKTIV